MNLDGTDVDGATVNETGVRQSRRGAGNSRSFEKTLLGVLTVLAVLAIAGAVLVNVALGHAVMTSEGADGSEDFTAGNGSSVAVQKTLAVDRLPVNVVGFETIARQTVPGQGDGVAEAVFVTLTMNLEAMIPTASYARVEVFQSAGDARAGLAELMGGFSLRPEDIQLNGVTKARVGFTTNEGAFAVGWVEGSNAVLVKSMFKDWIPAEKRDFLRGQALALAEKVDIYQRTGVEGVSAAGKGSSAPSTATTEPSTLGPLLEDGSAVPDGGAVPGADSAGP